VTDVLALAVVAAEWLAVGRLSGVAWPFRAAWPVMVPLWLLVGGVLVGLAQVLLALVGLGFGDTMLVLLVAVVLALAVRLVSPNRPHASFETRIEGREAGGWVVLGAVLAAGSVRSWVVPEAGWDAFSHWGLKAAAFATTGTIADAGTVHEYYPPLVPLLEAWLYLHRGSIDIDLAKTIWPLFGSAFAIALAAHLKLVLSERWLAPYLAALIVLGTTQLLEGFWTGQADLALTAYLTLATLAAWQWQRGRERQWLVQVAVFGAAAALTKYEGLPRVGIVVAALAINGLWCRTAIRPALVLTGSAIVSYAPWLVFRHLHGIAATSEHLAQLQPQALGTVLTTSVQVLAGVRTGGAVVVALLAFVAAGRKPFEREWRLLTMIVVGQLAATFGAFLVSEAAPDVQVRTSLTRLLEQFLPLALFAAAAWLTNVRPIIRAGR
jgi:hypothetical protein